MSWFTNMLDPGGFILNNNEGRAEASAELAAKQFKWQKQVQQETWKREDTAVQRRVDDMTAAGVNPVLAAGNAAQSGPIVQTGNAPSGVQTRRGEVVGSTMDALNAITQIGRAQADNALRRAEERKVNNEADEVHENAVALRQSQLSQAGSARIQADSSAALRYIQEEMAQHENDYWYGDPLNPSSPNNDQWSKLAHTLVDSFKLPFEVASQYIEAAKEKSRENKRSARTANDNLPYHQRPKVPEDPNSRLPAHQRTPSAKTPWYEWKPFAPSNNKVR